MPRKSLLIMTAIIGAFFSCVPSADATLVIIGITGEVTHVADRLRSLEGNINVGDIITGVYIYDLSTPGSDPWVYRRLYEHDAPPSGITLTVGGFVFMTDPENIEFTVAVGNNYPTVGGARDAFELKSKNNLPLSNGVLVSSIVLELFDPSASALSSEALPATAPVLEHWSTGYRDMRISGRGQASFTFYAHLTSAVLIPEPTTAVLLGLGGLAVLHKRRK